MRERDIFIEALQKGGPAEVDAYLAATCGGDDALRGRVDALLAEHGRHDGFILDSPPAGVGTTAGASAGPPDLAERPGSQVGPYKLLQQVGEGGMGVVFLAEQTRPVRRQVALKVIKAGMDSRQVVARFDAERQALAMMDHPNIARVLDAGATDAGRPYFVMELVKGVPITAYCDAQRLTPRDRLALFVHVCQAVQHAHTKGVIHRDLKPSNVLVALYDGRPVPKVIDFGVAKATGGGRLTDHTAFTGFGSVVGTPEYMSPEQAELNQLDVDTRSDVYSLGVILYELLTGSTPVERGRFRQASLLEMLRVVREEEAPRPSTRVSTTDRIASIAACRGLEPRKLGGVVRGELDWIVMRALEKDRNRRYETASALAADVGRYLADEPIAARPVGTFGYLWRWGRRNRLVAALVAATALVVLAGGVGAAVAVARIGDARVKADAEAREATRLRGLSEERERVAVLQAYQSGIATVYREAEPGPAELPSPDGLNQLLDRCGPALRGWEWRYLRRLNNSQVTMLPCRGRLLIDPAGRWPHVPAGRDGRASGFVHQGTRYAALPLADLAGEDAPGAVLSPDGRRLAWIADGAIRVKSLRDLKTLAILIDGGTPTGVAFSADGSRLAAALNLTTRTDVVVGLGVWDAETGAKLAAMEIPRGDHAYTEPRFGRDGQVLIVGKRWTEEPPPPGTLVDGSVRCFDVATGKLVRSLTGHRNSVEWIECGPDGRLAASASLDGSVRVWDLTAGREVLRLTTGSAGLFTLAFSPDGRRIAAGGSRAVFVWDALTGERVRTIRPRGGRVEGLRFIPGSTLLACSGRDAVEVFDAGADPPTFQVPRALELAFTPDGERPVVLSGSYHGAPLQLDPGAAVLDVATGNTLIAAPEHATSAGLSPDGRFLVTCGRGETVIRELGESGPPTVLETPFGWGEPLPIPAVAPGGAHLALAANGELSLWDVRARRKLAALAVGDPPAARNGYPRTVRLSFSPDGRRLVSVMLVSPPDRGERYEMRVWDVAPRRETCRLPMSGPASTFVFSADGGRLAAWEGRGAGGALAIFDAGTGKRLLTLAECVHRPVALAFHPDGTRLATAYGANVVLWDAASGRAMFTLRAHRGEVTHLAFSRDGHRLATVGRISLYGDSEVKIWDAAPPLPEAQGKGD